MIYNPFRTRLALQAEDRGIPVATGLDMLVGQAAYTAEKFTGVLPQESEVDRIVREILKEDGNIILVGLASRGTAQTLRLRVSFLADHLRPSRDIPDVSYTMPVSTYLNIVTGERKG